MVTFFAKFGMVNLIKICTPFIFESNIENIIR